MSQADFMIEDPSFRRCVKLSGRVEQLFADCYWAEGPVYFAAHRCVVWSDIPNNRMLKYDELNRVVGTFRSPSEYANGNTLDRAGRLLTCEQGTRRVTRTEHDGSITVIADRYGEGRFNSPNDIVVTADGSIWFTDPSYGIDSDYEGMRAPSELDGCHVYRVSGDTGEIEQVLDDFDRPNGLAFAPDERHLYVVDSGGTHRPDGPRHIRKFSVSEQGKLGGGDVFATCDCGFFDGIRIDEEGRLWAAAGDGVRCYESSGNLIGRINIPEPVSNLTFGGPKRNRLYITATSSLYTVLIAANGAQRP